MKNIKLKLGLAVLGLAAVLGVGATAVNPGQADAGGFALSCSKSVDAPDSAPNCFGDRPSMSRLEEW